VRLLVDANLSPVVPARLREAGHEAIRVYDVGLLQATGERIVEYALEHDYVIVSADTDFAAMLARLDRAKPSFVLLRHVKEMTPRGTRGVAAGESRRARRGSRGRRGRIVRARNDSSKATAVRKRVVIAFHGASMARAVENRPDSQLFALFTDHR
jgi:predicted nuclease of predicted toxin-antitoxin system